MIVVIALILILMVIGGIVFIKFSPQFGAKTTGDHYERIISSTYFKNSKFRNIEKSNFTPSNNPDTYKKKQEPNIKVIWFGHSALLLEVNNKKIFLDPMLGKRSSPISFIGPKRFNYDLPMKIEDIPELDAVLISHDHYDHLDYPSITKLKDKVKVFYVPLGVAAHLKSWGVDELKIVELDWWEQAKFEDLIFVCTPSHHFSGRGLFNRDGTLWCSWIIKGENENIFFSGDSGYSKNFKEIGDKFGPFNLTLLECGQYNKSWHDIHMFPEETVRAHIELRGELLMPIHWAAFKLSFHPWQEPVERLLKSADSLNVQVTTPRIGEPVILGKSVPCSNWWEDKELS
jgi:L-ascorbate metabolism protein UlaG (beta-lactamase superfamily)